MDWTKRDLARRGVGVALGATLWPVARARAAGPGGGAVVELLQERVVRRRLHRALHELRREVAAEPETRPDGDRTSPGTAYFSSRSWALEMVDVALRHLREARHCGDLWNAVVYALCLRIEAPLARPCRRDGPIFAALEAYREIHPKARSLWKGQ